MTEIHEPLRPLFVIECTPEAILMAMERNQEIGRMCRNEWVFIATLSPDSSEIHVLRNGRFERFEPETTELPVAESSAAWYRGWRDHLGFAVIRNGQESSAKAEASL